MREFFESALFKVILVVIGFGLKWGWDKWKGHRLLGKGAISDDDVAFQLFGIDKANNFTIASIYVSRLRDIYGNNTAALALLKSGFKQSCWMSLETLEQQKMINNPLLQRISTLFNDGFFCRAAGLKTISLDLIFGLQVLPGEGFQQQYRIIIVSAADLPGMADLRTRITAGEVNLQYPYLNFQVKNLEDMAKRLKEESQNGGHTFGQMSVLVSDPTS